MLGNAKNSMTGDKVRPCINVSDVVKAILPAGDSTGGSNRSYSKGTVYNSVGKEWEVVRRRKVRWAAKVQVHQI